MSLMSYRHIKTKVILGLQNWHQSYIRITKGDRDGLKSAIGLEITKYYGNGLQSEITK